MTRPLEEAVMEPSSSMVYSAMMLSCRKRPSGSFFCRAYHFPAYCHQKHTQMRHPVLATPPPPGGFYFCGAFPELTLLGSKSSLTLKLSTTQDADRLRSTQAKRSSSRASLECSIPETRRQQLIHWKRTSNRKSMKKPQITQK